VTAHKTHRYVCSVDYRIHANSLNSPLLRLPAELRNRIFALTVKGAVAFVLPRHAKKHGDAADTGETRANSTLEPPRPGSTGAQKLFPLSATCRQLRYEASPLFYKFYTFDLSACHFLAYPKYLAFHVGQERTSQMQTIMIGSEEVKALIALGSEDQATFPFPWSEVRDHHLPDSFLSLELMYVDRVRYPVERTTAELLRKLRSVLAREHLEICVQ
jgi:hypothetical protein